MKKSFACALAAAVVGQVFAQESEKKDEPAQNQQKEMRQEEMSTMWPAPVAICQWPAAADLVGIRFTLPFSSSQENVTGIDLGFWGHSLYFEGIQVNVIRNDVKDDAAGFQIGIYNSVGCGDMFGLQAGLWNEANSIRWMQVGLVNLAGEAEGFQIGLINRAESMYGFQIGLINSIREAELRFMPLVNIGF